MKFELPGWIQISEGNVRPDVVEVGAMGSSVDLYTCAADRCKHERDTLTRDPAFRKNVLLG